MAFSMRVARATRATNTRIGSLVRMSWRSSGRLLGVVGSSALVVSKSLEEAGQSVAKRLVRGARAEERRECQEQYVRRFDVHQRIQHVLMFTSFLTLAFTGLPQKLHAWDVSQWFIAALGGLEMTQQIHRTAAFVMLFGCLYHALYVVNTLLVRRQFTALQMIPSPKDFFDAVQMFKYFLGLSHEKPRFGRFSYLEKFDYWAVFWGIAIIGGSGLILLFPVEVSRVVPGGIVPVAHVAHSDEAVLAVGWIFVVHFFYAHFAPAVFPFNASIFTGRVRAERYAEEHPLDHERVKPGADGTRDSLLDGAEAVAAGYGGNGAAALVPSTGQQQIGGTGGPS